MSDTDEIIALKERVSVLETVVTNLVLANMKLINTHLGLISANNLKTDYLAQNIPQDAQTRYFDTFDAISADFDKMMKS